MFISKTHLVEVFFTKLVLNLKSEASKTYLSYLWWILEPALMVGVFYLVFAVFLARGTSDFVIFLVCGKIPFLWFSKSVMNASRSIIAGRGLINSIAIPMPFFPMLVVSQDAVKQSVVFACMLLFFLFNGQEITWVWLSLAVIIIVQFLLISGCAMLAAAITPYLPDFKYLIATCMMALMFGSGIFYSYEDVLLPEHQRLFLMNPVANLINNYRLVLMDNAQPDWLALLGIGIVSTLLIAVMTIFYRVFGKYYARIIAQ